VKVSPRWAVPAFLLVVALNSWAAPLAGIVVETVSNYSEAGRAGLQPGDVILSWSRGTSVGAVESPYDLIMVEIEQAPRGTVTLKGLRGSQGRDWKLGQEEWGIESRPNFRGVSLQLYSEGKKHARKAKVKQARSIWRAIALNQPQQTWIYAWCAADAADIISRFRSWNAVDALYVEALMRARGFPVARIPLLRAWARTFEERGDWKSADRIFRKSLFESEKLAGETLLVASVLNDTALIASWRRDLLAAYQYYRRALTIDQKLASESLTTARTLISLATVALNRGDEKTAQELLNEAEHLSDKAGPKGATFAKLTYEFGYLYLRRGDLGKAKQYLLQAQTILESRSTDEPDLARTLNSLAFISARQGDLIEAEQLLRRGLAIYEKEPIDPILGFHLTNDLGVLAYERGDLDGAISYWRRTETIVKKTAPDSIDHAGILINLGLYAIEMGDLKAAHDLWLRALAIIEKMGPNTEERAKLLTGLSMVERRRGDFAHADEYASGALAILDQLAPEGVDMSDVLRELTQISRHRGALEASKKYLRRSLAIEERLVPSSSDYVETLAELAEVLQENHEPELAAKQYDLAINVLEGEMGRLGGNQAVRSGFRAQHEYIYKEYVDLLVQQGKSDLAFEVVERSRARTLLETLAVAHVSIREHVDASLLDQEQSLREQFASESNRHLRLLTGPHTDEQIKSSDTKITELLHRFADVESQLREVDPGYAALTQPEITSIKGVQENLLDPDTLLLEYSLGERRSYLWAVSPDSVSVYQLPKRAQIENAARHMHEELASASMANRTGSKAGTPTGSKKIDRLGYDRVALALSCMVLGPVARQLGHKRLLIVADGALNYIPFSALPIPNEPAGPDSVLVARHEIVSLPSASVLAVLRKEHTGRKEPPLAVAVLADPVFNPHDPRVKHFIRNSQPPLHRLAAFSSSANTLIAASGTIQLTRSARDVGLDSKGTLYFPRLASTRREAQAIMAATPGRHNLEALDFKASRALAISPELAQYKVLHFATHGLLDTKNPELSGLVFSLVDDHGSPQIGYLSLQDIYNLNLPVDMVVLSACETALGKGVRGEGVIGLTRGFMYAGAFRVVASLWKVNDVATSKLMERFYRAMEQDHMRPAAALRNAQLEMRSQKRWAAPYYWASFELQGEWR
jgi:CHAT domain-containing protein/Tfp pilus assembly protein PilF